MAASPDGTRIASASNDGTAKVWRVADGRLLATFGAPGFETFGANDAAFSPDGTRLLMTGINGAFEFDLASSELVTSLIGLETGLYVAYSRDGTTCASGSSGSGFEEVSLVSDCPGGPLRQTMIFDGIREHIDGVFSADGQTLVTTVGSHGGPSAPGFVRFWRVSDGVAFRTIAEPAVRRRGIALSPDGVTLAIAGADGGVWLHALADGAHLRTLSGHPAESTSAEFSPDGVIVASAGSDGSVRFWDAATGTATQTIAAHSGPASSACWMPNGTQIVSGGGDPFSGVGDMRVRLWDVASATLVRELTRHTGSITGSGYASGAARFVSADWFGTLVLSAGGNGDELLRRDVADEFAVGLVNDAAISPDGGHVAVSLGANRVRLLSGTTLDLVRDFTSLPTVPADVEFSLDGSRLVAALGNDGVRVWSVASGALLAHLSAPTAVAFAARPLPGGGDDLIVGGSSTVRRLTVPGGAVTWTRFISDQAPALAVAADGSLIAAGRAGGGVTLIDAASGAEVRTIPVHTSRVTAVALAPDGSLLVSAEAGVAPSIRVTRIADGTLLETLDRILGAGAERLDFVGAGRVAVARRDGTIVVVALDSVRLAGDANCDGLLNALDAGAFVALLLDTAGSAEACGLARADFNGDGRLDGTDVPGFVAAIVR